MWRAVRMLRADPRFAVAIVGMLALGISINTVMFTLVNAIVLRPLPFANADRLVSVSASNSRRGWAEAPVSVPDFQDWSAQLRSVRPIAAAQRSAVSVTDRSGQEDGIPAAITSAALFSVLRTNPLIGRGFVEDDDRAGTPCVVVLSRQLWVTRFGSDRGVLGRPLKINDHVCPIVGVVPDIDLPDLGAPSVWLPFGLALTSWTRSGLASKRDQRFLSVIGTLIPGTTIDQARAEMSALTAQLASTYPKTNAGFGAAVVPLKDRVLGNSRPAMLMLFGAVGLILLIGCVNVANLLLARGAMRRHEFALRLALGASRAHLARQLLAESLTFSLVGGGCGLALAYWMIRLLRVAVPRALPRLETVSLDTTAVLFTLVVVVLVAVVSGCVPLAAALRVSAHHSLNHGERTATGGSRARRIRNGLMSLESALAVFLLTGGVLAVESYWALSHIRLGFAPQNVLLMSVTPPSGVKAERRLDWYNDAMRAVAAIPGVESVGATQVPPLMNSQWTASFAIVGRPSPASPPTVSFIRVAGPYFHTMGIPLSRGRDFDEHDDAAGRATIIVNDAFARLFFPDGGALGAHLTLQDSPTPFEVVGVVGSTIQRQLEPELKPMLYIPFSQSPEGSRMTLVVRTAGREAGLRAAIRRAAGAAVGPRSVADVSSMDEVIEGALAPHRYPAMLLGVFAVLALTLACVGVYGVVAYAITQRTREIGIRIALGAHPGSVVGLMMRQALWVIGAGSIVGVLASLWLARIVRSTVYAAAPTDRLVFIAVPCIMLCVAALAAYVPARQASRIDPLLALRNQ
jgi:putative ABC transport system permease protein